MREEPGRKVVVNHEEQRDPKKAAHREVYAPRRPTAETDNVKPRREER